MDEIKIWVINISAFTVSLTAITDVLKILVLLVSFGYTLSKWWMMMHGKNKKDKE